ncbi:hypothetical protein SAMN05444417_3487 [Wenxinia saemankumensis]|uniref:Uncharacterized protein n=1 Tax=Wenxinia saemankumensis TaxID=1447782 RepID=A0A1M6I2Z1_9RHOB|nr:hypothetical protein SAMN05444417_3487 [Wenxinia saemankumensis]
MLDAALLDLEDRPALYRRLAGQTRHLSKKKTRFNGRPGDP